MGDGKPGSEEIRKTSIATSALLVHPNLLFGKRGCLYWTDPTIVSSKIAVEIALSVKACSLDPLVNCIEASSLSYIRRAFDSKISPGISRNKLIVRKGNRRAQPH